ncbi:hypothetical protein BH11BAC3_BH11BAC3_32270 [soil metagenome]
MGIFDFLTKKQSPTQPVKIVPANRPECDINKTGIVANLFKIPKDQRDNNWYQAFYENVATASFASTTPQVLTGPDGFPYFILNTPEENKPFESFCINNMKDDFLLDRGWGVVFNPAADKSADWVFTHGDIVSLYLNNEFATATDPSAVEDIEFTKTVGVLKKEEKVIIAQPSEDYFPFATRCALKLFLQNKGIRKPKVMMLSSFKNDQVIRKLAFNIHPENYPVTTKLDHLMQQVGWFLPRQYIIIPLSKKSPLASGLNEM